MIRAALLLGASLGIAAPTALFGRSGVTTDCAGRARPDEEIPECGVASAYCVLRMLGHDVRLHELTARIEHLYPGNDGVHLSMEQLRVVLESYGLHATSIRTRPENIGSLHVPAILFLAAPDWREQGDVGHFVVLEKVDAQGAHVLDLTFPQHAATGRTVLAVERLPKTWAGEALLVDSAPLQIPSGWLDATLPVSTLVLLALLVFLTAGTLLQRRAVRHRFRRKRETVL